MSSFDDLRRRDRENATRELAEKEAYERMMRSGQRMYDSLVRKCLRDLGEYCFGTTRGLIFSNENYEIENIRPGEWTLSEKSWPDPDTESEWQASWAKLRKKQLPAFRNKYIHATVRYTAESDSKEYFSVRSVTSNKEHLDKTKDTSEKELLGLLVNIAGR